jgi:hypothetical protein
MPWLRLSPGVMGQASHGGVAAAPHRRVILHSWRPGSPCVAADCLLTRWRSPYGTGQGIPGPGPGPAAQAEEERVPRRNLSLRSPASPAVITTDLRRARQRRAQAMADPPALPRTPRALRRNLHGHRRPSLRPRRRAVTPASPPARPAHRNANRAPSRYRRSGAAACRGPPAS